MNRRASSDARSCRLPLLVSILVTAITSASAQGTTTPVPPATTPRPPAVANSDSLSAAIPGIPTLPDVVTVVPFHPYSGPEKYPWILIQAELDGHRGTFSLDTGSPIFFLNATYLRPSATGGIDTITAEHQPQGRVRGRVTVHTLRIGTLVQHMDSIVAGLPSQGPYSSNATVEHYPDNGILGDIGLTAMELFETIIDYPHQRIILIRLDSAGRRLAPVPAYTPVWSAPLIDLPLSHYGYGKEFVGMHFWGAQALLGGVPDSVILDTGTPDNYLITQASVTAHLVNGRLDSLILAGRTFKAIPFTADFPMNLLGYAFLHTLKVVGFNHRTRQFMLYRVPEARLR